MYLNYELLRQKIDDFNEESPYKLPGYYFMGKSGEIKKLELKLGESQKEDANSDEI